MLYRVHTNRASVRNCAHKRMLFCVRMHKQHGPLCMSARPWYCNSTNVNAWTCTDAWRALLVARRVAGPYCIDESLKTVPSWITSINACILSRLVSVLRLSPVGNHLHSDSQVQFIINLSNQASVLLAVFLCRLFAGFTSTAANVYFTTQLISSLTPSPFPVQESLGMRLAN